MNGIRALILPITETISNNNAVVQKSLLYQNSVDTFERSTLTKDIAIAFRKQIIIPYSEWEKALPADGEEGAELLKKILTPFKDAIKNLSKRDAEVFTKLAFGENQVKMLELSSMTNKDLMDFKLTLENILGKKLVNFYPKN